MPNEVSKSKKKSRFDFLFDKAKSKNKDKQRALRGVAAIEGDIDLQLLNIPQKKRMSQNDERYWEVAVNYLSKDLISVIVNHKGTNWKMDFFDACVRRHQGGNYIKKC